MTAGPFERGVALLGQHRPDLAELEIRRAITVSPDDASLHAWLALCLTARAKHREAVAEARIAVRQLPDLTFPHYTLANAYVAAGRSSEAAAAADEALRLDPEDPSTLALLSGIRLDQNRTDDAEALAHRALAISPQHGDALRALSFVLVRRGRLREAAAIATGALSGAPEDAERHATLGWALLNAARFDDSLLAFREALRLEPEHEHARAGLLLALKARRGPYGGLLRLFMWESRLSGRTQWLLALALFPATLLVWFFAAQFNDVLGLVLLPVVLVVLLLVLLTWIGEPLSDLTIRLHPLGRHSLSKNERLAADLVGVCVLGIVFGLGFWPLTGNGAFGVTALFSGMMTLPVSVIFRCPEGWRRRVMAGYVVVLAACAVTGVAFLIVAPPTGKKLSGAEPEIVFLLVFLFGWKFSTWIGTLLRIGARTTQV